MPYYCTVPRCTSMSGKTKNVSFHQFPRDPTLAETWNVILKRGKPYTKYSKVCSLHFTPEDYMMTAAKHKDGQWRTLRKDAMPSRNLPTESPTKNTARRSVGGRPYDTSNLLDPKVQQMANAIFFQAMMAIRNAGCSQASSADNTDSEDDANTNTDGSQPTDQPSSTNCSNSSHDNITDTSEITDDDKTQHKTEPQKCTECNKYFIDPDVFTLHQRSHTNFGEKALETLQANPILANLLKQSNGNKSNCVLTNEILDAMTVNMRDYIQDLTGIITSNTQKENKGGLKSENVKKEIEDANETKNFLLNDASVS